MNKMEKEFVPYDRSLRLKALGFDEPCLMYIDDEEDLINDNTAEWIGAIKCPLKSQAFRWFREKYKLSGTPQYFTGGYYCYTINDMKDTKESNRLFTEFETYEEAELACLDKLLEIVETKSTQNTNDGRTMEKLIESNRKFDEKNNDNVKYDSSDRNEDMPNITNFFI